MKKNIAIIGATGYSGVELIRFLEHHPHVNIKALVSGSQSGVELASIYPHLQQIIVEELLPLEVEELAQEMDVIFFATPSGVSREWLPLFVDKGVRCIDLSGDFRLKKEEEYQRWYKHEAAPEKYLLDAVYGLSEIYPEQIKEASYIANPGCYPTATLLGLIPALKLGLIDSRDIIIDGKSGVSGAGRKASLGTHYAEINENVRAYKLGSHQHIPEIEQILNDNQTENDPIQVTFSTHLMPMTRGIMCTMYAKLTADISTAEVIEQYEKFYAEHSFVRIRPEGNWPATKEVYASNYCDIGLLADQRTNRLTIVSVIDNVVKGASGQAIQNMNLLFGWDSDTGLRFTPVYP